ncbi:DinB family protein [Actinoplanes sp. TRM 88003]|uniref:DinB family protein n=1 Tax=Paractinoplanes aksuensis TaxID=2939490 RepID=A0ABT1DH33_9ACTN|nr:DinB family protein [Actinoplanes aksuensis]MCO8270153.1 DinB family protein [Actinoplanes aksuensis]
MDVNWNETLLEQWTWHWDHQVRARLDGLTDDEYFWSPVPDPWTIGPGGIDWAYPPPTPAPFTTIAWRLGHVIVGVLAMRNTAHFGAPPASYEKWPWARTAADARTQLDEQLAVWVDGVRGLGIEGLTEPCGDKEPYPDLPMAALVLHINRELIHHLSEVALLRDLYVRGAGR